MAKSVTQERMYLETMEKVLADIDKVIIEKNNVTAIATLIPAIIFPILIA